MIASTLKVYVFSKQAAWYWITITLALATAVTVLTVPDNTYPIIYARSVLGVVFLLFLPGFTLIKTLYPSKLPIQTSSENLDTIERVALSLALSISLVPLVAFILLNYTPWGIRLHPQPSACLHSPLYQQQSPFSENTKLRPLKINIRSSYVVP